ncbi:MAG: aminoacetone oxidase family FAD-binding enzyme, partial [Pseudomonadota bacterium]
RSLVVATGGLSIPKMGATGLAYEIARNFGHDIIPAKPALVPFSFTGRAQEEFAALSGVSVDVEAKAETGPAFRENLLFTHRGLSGPSMLQVSSFWKEGQPVQINLFPEGDEIAKLKELRSTYPARTLQVALSAIFPGRLVGLLSDAFPVLFKKPMGELSNADFAKLEQQLNCWRVKPAGTEGWRTAEVTAGGIDTNGLSSKTMESKHQSGLYFIGECVDVTGWLGGYNFQWAWASAAAAAKVA